MGTPNVLFFFQQRDPSRGNLVENGPLPKSVVGNHCQTRNKYVQQPKMQFVGQIIMFWIFGTADPLHYLVDFALRDYLLATSRSSRREMRNS